MSKEASTELTIKSKASIAVEYEKKCGKFSVERDKDDGRTYIYTERFTAEPLYTDKTRFEDFPTKIKDLFVATFADSRVMEKFAIGAVRTEQEFEGTVKLQSLRSSHNYPFSAFLVTDNATDVVVGYEVIGNGSKSNTGEAAYLFNKDYHRSGAKKYVGYENVGALILGHGAELYKNNAVVNQVYSEETKRFTGGTTFTTVSATARLDNIGSVKILESLGFSEVGRTNKYGHDRHEFELNYRDISTDIELQGATANDTE